MADLVWAEHPRGRSLWKEGEIASAGLKALAETGNPAVLIAEAVGMGMTVRWQDLGAVVAAGLAATGGEVTFDHRNPCFSFAQPLAPSPDWFVGLNGCLTDEETGAWLDEVEWAFPLWDAGTDDGDDFLSENSPSNPPQPIRPLNKAPFSPARTPIRTIRLSLQGS